MSLTAVVLTGGDSLRLGEDKMCLPFNGQLLIERVIERLGALFAEIVVVGKPESSLPNLGVKVIPDIAFGKKSALRGIYTGLVFSDTPIFVVGCDMPFLNHALIEHFSAFAYDYDLVVPRNGSYYQPLHAFYGRRCLPVIERQLKQKDYKINNFYAQVEKIKYITNEEVEKFDPGHLSFFNINTPEDYEQALSILKSEMSKSTGQKALSQSCMG